MNIKEKILYYVFFYNRILIVVPLYVLSFSQIVLISHSQLFSFVFEEKKNLLSLLLFFSLFSSILEGEKKEDNSLVSIDSEILVY